VVFTVGTYGDQRGAGPYGLSAAAHLIRAGVDVRVFGGPMESWAHHMSTGMLLRSRDTNRNAVKVRLEPSIFEIASGAPP
jgi:flavin-dependent dehydrogenase